MTTLLSFGLPKGSLEDATLKFFPGQDLISPRVPALTRLAGMIRK
jgi:hypothetical protein